MTDGIEGRPGRPTHVLRSAGRLLLAATVAGAFLGAVMAMLVAQHFVVGLLVSPLLARANGAGPISLLALSVPAVVVARKVYQVLIDRGRGGAHHRWGDVAATGAAQLSVGLGAVALAVAGTSAPSGIAGGSSWDLLSPLRLLWMVLGMELVVHTARYIGRALCAPMWRKAIRSAAAAVIVAAAVFPAAMASSCGDPIPDPLVLPPPDGLRVVSDHQDSVFSTTDPWYARTLVLAGDESAQASAQRLLDHLETRGWAFEHHFGTGTESWTAGTKGWSMSIRYPTSSPVEDAVEMELEWFGGLCFS